MRRFFKWYCRLSPWYQAAVYSLGFGIYFGFLIGLMEGGVVPGGFLLGLVIGLVGYYGDHRERRNRIHPDEIVDDYPEDLERVEQRNAKQWLILGPAFLIAGAAVSWIVLGSGMYGMLVALLAAGVALWALGRFGGPNDPRWKRVRDEWKRQHMERLRAR